MADLSIQAILTAQTGPFQQGMRSASSSVRSFSSSVRSASAASAHEFGRMEQHAIRFSHTAKHAIKSIGPTLAGVAELAGGSGGILGKAGGLGSSILFGAAAGGVAGAAAFGLHKAVELAVTWREETAKRAEETQKAAAAAREEFRAIMEARKESAIRLRQSVVPDPKKTKGAVARELQDEIVRLNDMINRSTFFRLGSSGIIKTAETRDEIKQELAKVQQSIAFDAAASAFGRLSRGAGRGVLGGAFDLLRSGQVGAAGSSLFGRALSPFGSATIGSQSVEQLTGRFFSNVREGFDALSGVVKKWKADVESAAESAKKAGRGPLGEFKNQEQLLLTAWRQKLIGSQQFRLGLIEASQPLIDQAEQLLNRSPGGAVRGTSAAFDEIFRIENRDRAEKNFVDILKEQRDILETLAPDIAREIGIQLAQIKPEVAQF